MSDDNIIEFKAKKTSPNNKPKHPPMFNIPVVTKFLTFSFLFIHLIIWGLSSTIYPDAKGYAFYYAAFIPANITVDFTFHAPLTFITYAFLHASWLHILVNCLLLIALGSGLEKMIGWKKYLGIFFATSIIAILTHFAFYPTSEMPIVGASGGGNGIFGALLYFMMRDQNDPKKMWLISLVLIGIFALMGMIGSPDGLEMAWLAHVGGFLSGIGIAMQMRRK